MKEDGMNKLIELLLECKPQIHYLDKPKGVYDKKYWIGWYKREWDIGWWFSEEVIISKKFWFIQRLVKHFKLNMTKIDARIALSDFNATDRMLMALAISEDPIALLIDCLE